MSLFTIKSASVHDGSVTFPPEESRHLTVILRKKTGDKLECMDELGRRYHCVIARADARETIADIITVYTEEQEARPGLTLVFPLLKNGRSEWILQKGSELGVDRFIPFLFARTVVKPDWKQKAGRYARVIHEACKQSEQGREPELTEPCTDMPALVALTGGTPGLRIVCWELEKRVRLKELLRGERTAPQTVTVVVGPEGGIPADELEAFRQAGFLSAGLGKQILRSETACLAAAAAIRYEFA